MNVKTMCQGSTKSPDHNPAEHVLSSALKPSSKLSEYTLFWKNGVYYASIVQYQRLVESMPRQAEPGLRL